jgi:hypothetical protein
MNKVTVPILIIFLLFTYLGAGSCHNQVEFFKEICTFLATLPSIGSHLYLKKIVVQKAHTCTVPVPVPGKVMNFFNE